MKLPACLPPSVLPWYVQLDDMVKQNYEAITRAFKSRFNINNDRHQLQLKYHNLRAHNCTSLDAYAMKVQTIGMKLNKSRQQNVTQFILGLPDSTYRWVEDREPESIEEALRQAIDYELLFKPHKSRFASAEVQPPPRRNDPHPIVSQA